MEPRWIRKWSLVSSWPWLCHHTGWLLWFQRDRQGSWSSNHSPTASCFLDLACIEVKGKHWFLVGETLTYCQSFNLPRGWGFESRSCLRVGGKNSQGTSSVVGLKYCRVSKVVDQLFLTYLQWPNWWLPKKDSVKICWTPSFLIATTGIVGSFPLL